MLLEDKVAVIHGGGGRVGGAVARGFAREGARLFLAGRTPGPLDRVASDIAGGGGAVQTATVDALDQEAVDRHADEVAREAGRIDVCLNAISHGDVHGTPLLDMAVDDFARPVETAVRAQFHTTRAAARHMVRQGSGAILAITATTGRLAVPHVGGTGVTFDAIEASCRHWARELGPRGVRVVWLRTTGIADAIADERTPDYGAGRLTRDEHIAWMERMTMLGRLVTLRDVAAAATFLASDQAASMTAAGLNMSAGSVPE